MHWKDLVLESKYRLLRPHALRFWETMVEAESLSASDLVNLNFVKRNALVKHATANCLFYRNHYRNCKANIRSETDFHALPVLTKKHIREIGRAHV